MWFRYFIRKNFQGVDLSNEVIDGIYDEFKKYLDNKCDQEVLNKILPKNDIEVIKNMDDPLKINGLHPALTIHFDNFIRKVQKEQN